MESFEFTADRFSKSSRLDDDSNFKINDKNAIYDNENYEYNDSYNNSILKDSPFYTIYKANKQSLPKLRDDESIVSFYVETDLISVLITSRRVLVFNYYNNINKHKQSGDVYPFAFEFCYDANVYGVTPLCKIIPNPINPLKPDLVIVDAITGDMIFFESIKLSPSLSALQNRLDSRIKLFNGEFLTNIELFENDSLLFTTSQKRIVYITLRDQFSNISINMNEIFNNRPLISFMLSKSYSIREFSRSSHIISVKSFEISSINKGLIVLESSGRVSFLNYIKGSTSFSLEATYDLEVMLSSPNSLKFWDFDYDFSNKICAFLISDLQSNQLFNVIISFNNHGNPIILNNVIIPSLSQEDIIINPNISLLDNNSMIVKNNNKLILFNLNNDNLWQYQYQIIKLKNETSIFYSFENENKNKNNSFYLTSNFGIFKLVIKSKEFSSDIDFYIKNNIIQYLKFYSDISPIDYNFKKFLGKYTDNLEKIIIDVLNDIVENNYNMINDNLTVDKYLLEKISLVKKLVIYIYTCCDVDLDKETKIKILNNCELLSLSKKFYELIVDSNLNENVDKALQTLSFEGSIGSYLKNNTLNVLNLLAVYLQDAKNVHNEIDILNLAIFLKSLFVDAFIKVDDDIKQYLNEVGISTICFGHFDLLYNINEITKMLYNLSAVIVKDVLFQKYSEILIGLSFFLYYTTKEMICYLDSNKIENSKSEQQELENLLNENKKNWINVFILANKQNDIIPLVNKYRDFEALICLIDSKRELLQNLYEKNEITEIEYTNLSTDIELEIDSFFDYYGYIFAEPLFQYYSTNNKINIMFNNYEKHSDLLEKFLSSNANLNNFSWIYDIKTYKFEQVENKMIDLDTLKSNILLKNRKLHLSIGKLSSMCNKSKTNQDTSIIKRYNNTLEIVSIQEEIYTYMDQMGLFLPDFDEQKIIQTKYLLQNNFESFSSEVLQCFQKIKLGLTLTLDEIVKFISLANLNLPNESISENQLIKNSLESKVTLNDEFLLLIYPKIFKVLIFERENNSFFLKIIMRRLYLQKKEKVLNSLLDILQNEHVSIQLPKNYLCSLDLQKIKSGELKDYKAEESLYIN